MSELKNDSYFPALTGIRAIAAYMVFIHHNNVISEKIVFDFFQEFHVGVTLFFVLSGFLIAYRYIDTEKFEFKKYFVNRFARIYPVYFILTIATFSIVFFEKGWMGKSSFIVLMTNLTLLKGYFEQLKFTGIEPGWSLTVEETFYLLAPFIFFLVKKNRINMIVIPAGLILLGLSLVWFSRLIPLPNNWGFMKSEELLFNYTFFGRCFEFFIGIGLALFIKRNPINSGKGFATYSGMLGIFLSICLIALVKGDLEFGIRHPAGKLINTFFLPLFGIAVLYFGLIKEKTIVSRVLSSNIMVLLGKSSYIFYLIHVGFIVKFIKNYTSDRLVIFILLVFISVALFKFLEEPLNLYIRKKWNKTPVNN